MQPARGSRWVHRPTKRQNYQLTVHAATPTPLAATQAVVQHGTRGKRRALTGNHLSSRPDNDRDLRLAVLQSLERSCASLGIIQ